MVLWHWNATFFIIFQTCSFSLFLSLLSNSKCCMVKHADFKNFVFSIFSFLIFVCWFFSASFGDVLRLFYVLYNAIMHSAQREKSANVTLWLDSLLLMDEWWGLQSCSVVERSQYGLGWGSGQSWELQHITFFNLHKSFVPVLKWFWK